MVFSLMGILAGFLTFNYYDTDGVKFYSAEYHYDGNITNIDSYIQSLSGTYNFTGFTLYDYFNCNVNDSYNPYDSIILCGNNAIDYTRTIDRVTISLKYYDYDLDVPRLVDYGVIYDLSYDYRGSITHNGTDDFVYEVYVSGGSFYLNNVANNLEFAPFASFIHNGSHTLFHSTGEYISPYFYDLYHADTSYTASSYFVSKYYNYYTGFKLKLNETDLNPNTSYNAGYNAGYSNGYNTGYDVGETDGTYAGYEDGYLYGYNIGFTEGENTAHTYTFGNLFKSIVDTPIWFLQSLFGFSLFGQGETLVGIITSLITALIVIALVKKVF